MISASIISDWLHKKHNSSQDAQLQKLETFRDSQLRITDKEQLISIFLMSLTSSGDGTSENPREGNERPVSNKNVKLSRPNSANRAHNGGSQPELASDLALIFERRRRALQEAEDQEYFGGSAQTEQTATDPETRRWSAPSSSPSASSHNKAPASTQPAALSVRFAEPKGHRKADPAPKSFVLFPVAGGCGSDCSAACSAPGCGARRVTRCGRTYLKEDGRLIALPPAGDALEPPPPPPPPPPPDAAPGQWEEFDDS